MSTFEVRGRRSAFLPILPKVPKIAGLLRVPTFVGANAAALSQLTQLAVTPAHEFLLYGLTPGSKVPRSLPIPVPEISVPCSTVIGRPLDAETIPPTS